MATQTETPVFFIATRTKKTPVVINFYTKKGEPVASRDVKKVKTKAGMRFYIATRKLKKR